MGLSSSLEARCSSSAQISSDSGGPRVRAVVRHFPSTYKAQAAAWVEQ